MGQGRTISRLLISVTLVLVVLSYVAWFFIYVEYREKTVYFQNQALVALDKIENLEGNIKGLYVALENSKDENTLERKNLLFAMEDIKKGVKLWERKYIAAISELRGEVEALKVDKLTRMVENLEDEIVNFKVKVQDLDLKLDEARGVNVDLGRISVKKDKKGLRRER